MDMALLKSEIQKKKVQLEDLVKEKKSFSDPAVQKKSQELDELIVKLLSKERGKEL